ncbi:hypothetical protein GCM10008090_25760 [Arenicella chitinivorans]|uniref:Uncharacterized protein n=1 Tax=Arenicella chitinivorans TaxID=1329800 RepID=A0A918RXB3_9GAMM|nr:hypothetical protein [Arenicella chitinivorans]GHA15051.1 hypothetical protein GCM10008090_25760 [Arenicella chitinivorans]
MRDKIFGITGILLGVVFLASAWNIRRVFGSETYESAQESLLIGGILFLLGSIYTLIKKPNEPKN